MAFAFTLPRFFPLFCNAVRVHSLGHERRGNGGQANESPSLVGVLDEFTDDQWRKEPCGPYPMTCCSERRMRLVIGLPERLFASVGGVMGRLRHDAILYLLWLRPSLYPQT